MTDTVYKTGNLKFTKSQNSGVRIEFTDNSHDPVELTTNQWEQLLQSIEPQYASMRKSGSSSPIV